jgi:Arc/MetJ-type ribon-helix-helix transcriptional regulator
MAGTITVHLDDEAERALDVLTRDGNSRSAAVRQAILEAARHHQATERRRAALRMDLGPPDGVNVAEKLARER